MFALESPHQGDSNVYTQYTIFNMNKKNILNYPKSAAMGFFSKGLRNEFETVVVNEPSVFEPLKFYVTPNKHYLGEWVYFQRQNFYYNYMLPFSLWVGVNFKRK